MTFERITWLYLCPKKGAIMLTDSFIYGIEIIEGNAYINPLGDLSVYHPSHRDNDFVGNQKECEKYLKSKEVKHVYGNFQTKATDE
jgi:hypothetical protein